MITLSNRAEQIDDLLDRMAEDIQLDDTRYDRMKAHYEAIKNWIEGDVLFFKKYKYEIYPHGSVRISTTVKPYGKDEFDLDIALHIKTQWARHTPAQIYDELNRRLKESEIYKPRMELKNRCIRINYSGDFHLDILPGIEESEYDLDKLRVPDKERKHWVSSNPRGYAKWFLQKANTVKMSLLEKAIRAEALPADSFAHKKPLQRAVQLLKRYRDIYFHGNDEFETSSIVLTTLAGNFYNGEESIFDTVEGIINAIRKNMASAPSRIKVLNPVNAQEDFTDKWDGEPRYYQAFKEFVGHLHEEWQKLKGDQGIITEGRILKGLFGDDLLVKAQKSQALITEQLRTSKQLGANRSSGILTSAYTAGSGIVKPNTFYGE